MTIPESHEQLVSLLVDVLANEPGEAKRRWQVNAELAQDYARKQKLLLALDWTAAFALDPHGDVWVLPDSEDPPRIASEQERRSALFRAIHVFPELVPLLPERPAQAVTCSMCNGAGTLLHLFRNPKTRSVICQCGLTPISWTG